MSRLPLFIIGIVVVGAVGTGLLVNGLPSMTPPIAQPASPLPPRDYTWDATRAVVARLKDPESAKFGKIFTSNSNPSVVCGFVNARNGFGGYTGMEPFVYYVSSNDVQMMKDDVTSWKKTCLEMPPLPPPQDGSFDAGTKVWDGTKEVYARIPSR